MLSKEQYTDQIRALCSQNGTSGSKSDSFVPTLRTPQRRIDIPVNVRCERNQKSREKIVGSSGFNAFAPDRYYVDEEQPDDLVSYNLMVNGTHGDPRILPAIVDTLKHLRRFYYQMLIQAKRKSLSPTTLKLDNFRSKGSDTYSSDELLSSETSVDKPQYLKHKSVRAETRPEDSNAGNCNGLVHVAPHWGLNKTENSVEIDKCTGDADGRDSDSGIQFDCDAIEGKSSQLYRLHEAAKEGDVEKIIQLILDCCNVNGQNDDGWPALEYALSNSKFRAALFLIEAGTDINRYTVEKVDEYERILGKARNYTYFIRTAV